MIRWYVTDVGAQIRLRLGTHIDNQFYSMDPSEVGYIEKNTHTVKEQNFHEALSTLEHCR